MLSPSLPIQEVKSLPLRFSKGSCSLVQPKLIESLVCFQIMSVLAGCISAPKRPAPNLTESTKSSFITEVGANSFTFPRMALCLGHHLLEGVVTQTQHRQRPQLDFSKEQIGVIIGPKSGQLVLYWAAKYGLISLPKNLFSIDFVTLVMVHSMNASSIQGDKPSVFQTFPCSVCCPKRNCSQAVEMRQQMQHF